MLVQIVELEEVAFIEISDATLEANAKQVYNQTNFTTGCVPC